VYRGLDNYPTWQRGARPRLGASVLIATILVAAIILGIEFPAEPDALDEIEVFIVSPRQPEPEPPVTEDLTPLEEVIVEQVDRPAPLVRPEPEQIEQAPRDWYAQMDDVVDSFASEQQKTYALNPVQAELRRNAAQHFRPSRAPVEKKIWENVETDQLGRKILVSGDCHRVVDDPSAVRNYDFRTFHQFMTFCSKYKRQPKELPWVEEIRERHVYLQPDDEQRDIRTDYYAELQ
jgi:hypothetical protein